MKLPYGIADFHSLRRGDYLYIDRTDILRPLEELDDHFLLFLRPRRFGKSLWLSTLGTYYDLAFAQERLWEGLAIGREPTPLAHRYFVLRWDFSPIDSGGPADEINGRLDSVIRAAGEDFLRRYREHLPSPVVTADRLKGTLDYCLAAVRQTPYKLYLLIDEYDNFANAAMSDPAAYRRLLAPDSLFVQLFVSVQRAMEGQGLERVFVTGVSPAVMLDIPGGTDFCRNVSREPWLNELCGFREGDVRDIAVRLIEEMGDTKDRPTVEGAIEKLRNWYDGYSFAPAAEKIYNPTRVLTLLGQLQEKGLPQRQPPVPA